MASQMHRAALCDVCSHSCSITSTLFEVHSVTSAEVHWGSQVELLRGRNTVRCLFTCCLQLTTLCRFYCLLRTGVCGHLVCETTHLCRGMFVPQSCNRCLRFPAQAQWCHVCIKCWQHQHQQLSWVFSRFSMTTSHKALLLKKKSHDNLLFLIVNKSSEKNKTNSEQVSSVEPKSDSWASQLRKQSVLMVNVQLNSKFLAEPWVLTWTRIIYVGASGGHAHWVTQNIKIIFSFSAAARPLSVQAEITCSSS